MKIVDALLSLLAPAIAETEEKAKRLAAYRQRHSWRAGDKAALQELNLSPVAQRRLAGLTGRGRPVVTHNTPAARFARQLAATAHLANPNATARERLTAAKKTKFWPHYVEAIYRGE